MEVYLSVEHRQRAGVLSVRRVNGCRTFDLERPLELHGMRSLAGIDQAGDGPLKRGIDHAASAGIGGVEDHTVCGSRDADILPIVRYAPVVAAARTGTGPDVTGGGCRRVGANVEGGRYRRGADGHSAGAVLPDHPFIIGQLQVLPGARLQPESGELESGPVAATGLAFRRRNSS